MDLKKTRERLSARLAAAVKMQREREDLGKQLAPVVKSLSRAKAAAALEGKPLPSPTAEQAAALARIDELDECGCEAEAMVVEELQAARMEAHQYVTAAITAARADYEKQLAARLSDVARALHELEKLASLDHIRPMLDGEFGHRIGAMLNGLPRHTKPIVYGVRALEGTAEFFKSETYRPRTAEGVTIGADGVRTPVKITLDQKLGPHLDLLEALEGHEEMLTKYAPKPEKK